MKQLSISSTETIQESGQARAGKYIGYAFEAQSGQELSYRTKDNICVWVYAPDTQLLTTKNLTQNGKYIIQISAPQGSTSFSLEMTLGSFAAVSSLTPSTLSPASVLPRSSPPSSKSSPDLPARSKSAAASSPVTGLSEKETAQLVQNWLNAKKRLFAPPYEEELAANLTTGDRYTKTIGAIKWLRENNAYYQYKLAEVDAFGNFSASSDQAQIDVNVTEDLVLYINGRVDEKNTSFGSKTKGYRFYFRADRGNWKIENVESL
ncbi:hypothetical protein BCD67_17875 [Oscillatoriales cyanobacterium USR001]|nr:hypothetical protein BCD67_17875 [Oscillatoriales cyanobacterium USR001]